MGQGRGERKREMCFSLMSLRRKSQSAHVNELENAIKNIYIPETVIRDLM